MKQKILLMGEGEPLLPLVRALLLQGCSVTVINSRQEECRRIAAETKATVFCGSMAETGILKEAGAEGMDIAIAISSVEEDNLIFCELCRRHYAIAHTVAVINDPEKACFFSQHGVDSVVCTASEITRLTGERRLMGDLVQSVCHSGAVTVAEVPIALTSPAVGKMLWEIPLPAGVIVGCILRDGSAMIPMGDTHIAVGDLLVLLAEADQKAAAILSLTGK